MSKKLLQVFITEDDKSKLKEISKKNNRTMNMQALHYIQSGLKEEDVNGLSDNQHQK